MGTKPPFKRYVLPQKVSPLPSSVSLRQDPQARQRSCGCVCRAITTARLRKGDFLAIKTTVRRSELSL